jgi:UrcA family protein
MLRPKTLPVLLALLITTPALAEPHVWQTGDGFTIRATGLDLRTTDGREALLRRVDHASARMCRTATPRIERERCAGARRAEAIARAPIALRTSLALALAAREQTRLAAR